MLRWLAISLAGLLAGCANPFAPVVEGIPAEGVIGTRDDFALYIEQDGKLMAIQDRTAALRKAPFTLVVVFASPSNVLVNCSDSPALFDTPKPLKQILSGSPILEAPGNPQHQVVLTNEASHDWFVRDGASHTFESVTMKDGVLHGRRTIEAFTRPGTSRRPIESLEGNALYFVFVSTWPQTGRIIERHTERLKILFR
ncbi:MAG: hypothetical protein NTV86_14635 [Planctomycetota bacterium]|nr:hypothetical protein [Planctomycetota bacterium]